MISNNSPIDIDWINEELIVKSSNERYKILQHNYKRVYKTMESYLRRMSASLHVCDTHDVIEDTDNKTIIRCSFNNEDESCVIEVMIYGCGRVIISWSGRCHYTAPYKYEPFYRTVFAVK